MLVVKSGVEWSNLNLSAIFQGKFSADSPSHETIRAHKSPGTSSGNGRRGVEGKTSGREAEWQSGNRFIRGGRRWGKTMFRGNHTAKVDEKGRLKLPAAFKQLLDVANVTQVYITSTDGKGAEVWPLPEWEKREQKLAEYSTLDPAVAKYLDLTSYYGHQVEIDSQARVLLPQILRSAASLDAEVTVFGKLNFLDVRNRGIFERELEANGITNEDRKSLAAILKPQS